MKKKRELKKSRVKKRSSVKQGFTLKEEYKQSWGFIKDSRNFIYVAILLFGIFCVVGFFFEDLINLFFNFCFGLDLNTKILEYIELVLQETEGMGHGQLVGYIFFRNLQSSFIGMLSGIFVGIFPIIALVFNGYLLGFVAFISVKAHGVWVLWRVFPHGIFELPAVFLSLGLGLRLGFSIFSKSERFAFKNSLLNSLRIFLLIVFPLLIIAAIIEASLIFASA